MARILIQPSALAELRAVEPIARRRELVSALSELGPDLKAHRLATGGLCRFRAAEHEVLYRRREADVVIAGIRLRRFV